MNTILNEYFWIFLNWILELTFFSIIQRSIEFSISIGQGYDDGDGEQLNANAD